MKPIIQLHNISDINNFVKSKTNHPLVAVVDFGKADEYIEEGTRISADFYSIMFKNYCANKLRYGRQSYDFQEGNLICIAPKQVLTMDKEIEKKENINTKVLTKITKSKKIKKQKFTISLSPIFE